MTETYDHLDEKRREPSMPYPYSPSSKEDWNLKINEDGPLSRKDLEKIEFDKLEKRARFRKQFDIDHCVCFDRGHNHD